ncbi:MAG: GPR endopeptidase [Clostridia bacterium]|nr:GPR endopeptidase [Clostridia bacterium]
MYPLFAQRTSQAMPSSALILENFGFSAPMHAMNTREFTAEGFTVSTSCTVHGSYHSIITENVWQSGAAMKTRCLRVLSDILGEYIRKAGICLQSCRTLVCGLGNGEVTPDALGQAVCRRIPAMTNALMNGVELYVFCPGVPARTGIPTDTLVRSVAELLHADLLITVDALCARSLTRLASVIQITDSGVTPGSGGNDTPESGEISIRTMPCPVITIGVPTVISSDTMIRDAAGTLNMENPPPSLPVSHTAIDAIVSGYSEIIAGAVNRTLLAPVLL